MIHLHKEGLFYVAYEHSCYAFHRYIKPFKPSKRYVKSAGQEVVKLGFPSSGLEKLMADREWEKVTDKHVAIPLNDDETIDEQAYSEWKKSVPVQSNQGKIASEAPKDVQRTESERLVRMVLAFPLENRTPMLQDVQPEKPYAQRPLCMGPIRAICHRLFCFLLL